MQKSASNFRSAPDLLAIRGYASLFERRDLNRDVVKPDAFTLSLTGRFAAQFPFLFEHDPSLKIGTWQHIEQDAKGLRVEGELDLQRLAQIDPELPAQIMTEQLKGLSIGYRTINARLRPDGIRELYQIELWEISLVRQPMLAGALFELTTPAISAISAQAPLGLAA